MASGSGNQVYVGSLRDGDIWRGDVRVGAGSVLVDAPAGRTAVGLKVDLSGQRIFVAGGGLGKAFVYDSRTGADLGALTLTTATDTFINDVTLTRGGAWFTDSRQPALYFVPFLPGGSLGPVRTLALTGPAADTSGAFNLNGIAALPDGSVLIVVHSGREELITIDPGTGASATIDLGGGSVPNGDGILLDGPRLWVGQNFSNQVSEVRLSPDYASGSIVSVRTSPEFMIPTTIARVGNDLVVVDSRLDLGIPGPLDAAYSLVVLTR
ncbi:hypothetical protein [Pengzhenrongella sp.]|uniref:hypothetical protein n=1 Tax=Pengzhenrongella sp. TaxID=2888820 RepID=UPI002F9406E8